jgi:hypothetical protein
VILSEHLAGGMTLDGVIQEKPVLDKERAILNVCLYGGYLNL